MARRAMFTPLMVALLFMGAAAGFAAAQTNSTSDCGSKLVACADYLKSTNPPASCCDPLKETVETQLTCLCNLYSTPNLLQSLGVNVTDALQLSRRCGITSDLSSCNGTASSPSSQPPPPPASGGDNGSAGRVGVGFTGLSFLLLSWASMLLN
ncbi:hypothetical protein L6164_006466 [Bauhinia variegata]|uniref:Uncharacterized protein n=1 Tax=Bauhinia variegata TaxID=167791 RepID=A0ACB9PUE4_BAUVA|nr:hypothetical protein L6164_006466 [Bauhinia variegata]